MSQRVSVLCLLNLYNSRVGEAKASPNRANLCNAEDPKPGELTINRVNPESFGGKPEPVVGEMAWEDLWLGAICQSNPEIAGSPRNIFRYSASNLSLG